MKILNIVGREILDSRGLPTVACDIILEDGACLSASVPAGSSKGKYESIELRDGDDRLMGLGVTKAVNIINNIIAPLFVGKEPNAVQYDLDMIQLDGTTNKSKLGANAILAVSMAMYKAHAYIENIHLYDFIAIVSGSDTISLPIPMINFINGGMHADNNLSIQEYLVIPYGAANVQEAIDKSVTLFYFLKQLLKINGKKVLTGDEGGFASDFSNDAEPIEFILKAIEEANLGTDLFALGIDVAASQLYKDHTYKFDGSVLDTEDLIKWYVQLCDAYNIYSIEDGLAEDDIKGWSTLTKAIGDSTLIVGDDLFATNPERIAYGIEHSLANAAVIKPNQIGTITESLQAIQLCQEYGMATIVSHRSGETTDTFIVDLAVGSNATHVKCGGLSRGERISKYNRLLEIENILSKF